MGKETWWSRRMEGFWDNAVFALIVLLAGSLATAFGLAQLIDAQSAAIIGLFVFACLGVAWNQIRQIVHANRARKLTNRSPQEIERQIRDWLYEYQFTVKPEPTPIAHFRVIADDKRELPVTVAMPKDAPWVVVSSRLSFEPDRRADLAARYPRVIEDVGLEMIRLDVELEFGRTDAGEIENIVVARLLLFSAQTTALEFLQAIRSLRGALTIAATIFNRAAGQTLLPVKGTSRQSKPSSAKRASKGGGA